MTVKQSEFRDALLDSTKPVPAGLHDGRGRAAGRRFSVYRNNVAVSLTEALELSFPAIVKLIGEENFKKVAGVFLRRNLPGTPTIMYYGAEFPDFLEGFAPLRQYAYLPDVARLEQAQRESYHAVDADPIDLAALQSLPPEALTTVRFELAPAVRLVRSAWPIHAIWAYNIENGPKPEPGAQTVLITRPGFDPALTPVGPGTADFVDALADGAPLAAANDRAMQTEADFELSAALALLLNGQAIASMNTGDFPE